MSRKASTSSPSCTAWQAISPRAIRQNRQSLPFMAYLLPCKSLAEQHDAHDQARDAGEPDKAHGMNGHAKQAEMIEAKRGQHLAGDQQREEGGGSNLRNQQDGQANEDRPEKATAPRPPWNPLRHISRGHGFAHGEREQRHANGADKITREARPCSRAERHPQIGIERLLDDHAYAGPEGQGDG